MKRLFVSLPMKGKTDDEIQKCIREAYEKVKTLYPYEEIELMDTLVNPVCDPKAFPVFCLSESLKLMAQANIIYFAPGWKEARYCKVQQQVATMYMGKKSRGVHARILYYNDLEHFRKLENGEKNEQMD